MSAPWSSKVQISGLPHPRDLQKKEKISGLGEKKKVIRYLRNNVMHSFFCLELSHSDRSSSCFAICSEE